MMLRHGMLIALFAAAAACGGEAPPAPHNTTSETAVRYLDTVTPELRQPVTDEKRAAAAKFVRVTIAEVLNPRKYGLAFDVYFEPANGQRSRLGGFSLFPADNPGSFIVPTQGKVRGAGSVIVTMTVTDPAAAGEQPRVGIGGIALTDS